ncbi:MAG: XdhC family protein [Chitinophagales bacterium]
MKIWRFLLQKIKNQESAMLLYVIDNHGSSPGRKGFKMALSEDGEFKGTIGGGIMEVKLLELARQRLKQKAHTVLIKKQYHDKKHAKNQSGMICSGEQTVAIIPLQKEHLPLLQTILSEKSNHLKIRLTKNGISLGGEDEQERLDKLDDIENFEVVSFLKKAKRVHIFGGGHVGLALSEALSLLDYYIIIYDNRLELNTLQKNTFADEIHVIDYREVLKVCDFEENDSVVMVTFSYRTDKLLLQQLYKQSFVYIGMMGSKAKIETLYQELQIEGISYEQVSHIAAPIGVKIHSKTAMEIAFSIAAEMIFERNKNLP